MQLMKTSFLLGRVDSIDLSTAGVLVASLLLQNVYGDYTEAWSELLCWSMVLVAVEVQSWVHAGGGYTVLDPSATTWHSTVIAGGIALGSFCRSVEDVRWIVPLVTPILFAFRLYGVKEFPTQGQQSQSSWFTSNTLWLQAAIGLTSVLALGSVGTPQTFAIAGLFLFGQLITYVPLINASDQALNLSAPQTISFLVRAVARRAIPAVLLSACGKVLSTSLPPKLAFGDICLAGVLKATNWVLLFNITQRAPWDIATTTSTFAFSSSINTYALLSFPRALARLMTSLTALTQTILSVSKPTKTRHLLYFFALCPLIALLLQTDAVPRDGGKWRGGYKQSQHPIELLIQRSSESFNRTLNTQSATLEAAVAEYHRRYQRSPPPGFDKWFEYAKAHESPIIDEFDIITNKLQPFWNVSPAQIRENLHQAYDAADHRLLKVEIQDRDFHVVDNNWMVAEVKELLRDFVHDLPNMQVLFNSLDEPRVVIDAFEHSDDNASAVGFYDLSHREIWETVTQPCTNTLRRSKEDTIHTYGLPFVENARDAKDLCQHPEYGKLHGFFMSPTTFLVTNSTVPILSQAAPSTFGDVLYPSPFYTESYDMGKYKEGEDPEWEQKKTSLYWAGSTTGSYDFDDSWHSYHRQRFITVTRQLEGSTTTFLTETKPGVWETYRSREILSRLYDAKFTAIIQCAEAQCKEETDYFQPSNREEAGAAYKSRFIFDIDGNSFSGRFYTLLGSRSVVLKQTIFEEWHDERLFPWVHYVPVSISMDELPETMRFLALTENGSKRARQIAENGREWRSKALRKEDASIFLYRLLLEYARLLDDSRVA
ncbi:MAG: F-actin-capping protein subunit beta [Peltula sp. TS41687]|nr:MAG: F-actin-capping protein subunit beta [Peltula sp. TS41687]